MDDKSTSDNLCLNSAMVLDDEPLKQLTHLLKSHLQTVGYDKTDVLCIQISSMNGRFALNCHMGGNQIVKQTDYYYYYKF